MTDSPVYVSLEFTPNPNTLKYSVNRTLVEKGAVNITQKSDANAKSPLAAKLFDIAGIGGVMLGRDFVTVTKTEDGDWDTVHKSASNIIETHLTRQEPVFTAAYQAKLGGIGASGDGGTLSVVESKIREILDRDIRPAVAMDGGDITFERFEDGVVYLQLQGSCSGCPSSTMTLKMGIETRLKEALPNDVTEVVSV